MKTFELSFKSGVLLLLASAGVAAGARADELGRADSSVASRLSKSVVASRRVYTVLATAEGLIGGRTATGAIIQKWSEGAALPSRRGLGRRLAVVYLKKGTTAAAKVGDVGPWNINDPYWETGRRPQAESGRDRFGRRTNRAGIDLYNATWYRLLKLRAYDRRLIERTSGVVKWQFNG